MTTDENVLKAVKDDMAKRPAQKPADDAPIYEKTRYLNYVDLSDTKIKCVDKVEVKKYVKEVAGDSLLFAKTLQILGDGRDPNSIRNIDLTSLPRKFIIKRNNACQRMIFCWDKTKFDVEDAVKEVSGWGNTIPGLGSREYQYSLVKPLLFVEELLTDNPTDDLTDYRFWCMNGRPLFVAMNKGRGMGGQIYVDTEFNKLDLFNRAHMPKDKNAQPYPKPSNFKDMVKMAEKLSKPFKFVRIDLYSIKGKTYLGEFTFSPGGYQGRFVNSKGENQDIRIGRMLQI
jgi:hypothetical protein